MKRKKGKKGLNRREFIQASALGGVALGLPTELLAKVVQVEDPLRSYPDRSWEDSYRKMWSWDAEGFAFHCSNCQGNCAWTVYARDGVVIREEQIARYPQIHPEIPDANPRGCNKGGGVRGVDNLCGRGVPGAAGDTPQQPRHG